MRGHTHQPTHTPSRHSFNSGTKCSNSISSRAERTSLALSVFRLALRAKLFALCNDNHHHNNYYTHMENNTIIQFHL